MSTTIRSYSPFDNADMHAMLRNYGEHIEHRLARNAYDPNQIDYLLTHIRAGAGITLVAEIEGRARGLIMGLKIPNIWNPQIILMHEIAFWVDALYRHKTRAGYLLVNSYITACEALKKEDLIQGYTLSNFEKSEIDYSKFGLTRWQEEWINAR